MRDRHRVDAPRSVITIVSDGSRCLSHRVDAVPIRDLRSVPLQSGREASMSMSGSFGGHGRDCVPALLDLGSCARMNSVRRGEGC